MVTIRLDYNINLGDYEISLENNGGAILDRTIYFLDKNTFIFLKQMKVNLHLDIINKKHIYRIGDHIVLYKVSEHVNSYSSKFFTNQGLLSVYKDLFLKHTTGGGEMSQTAGNIPIEL